MLGQRSTHEAKLFPRPVRALAWAACIRLSITEQRLKPRVLFPSTVLQDSATACKNQWQNNLRLKSELPETCRQIKASQRIQGTNSQALGMGTVEERGLELAVAWLIIGNQMLLMVRYTGLQGKLFRGVVGACSVGAEAWLKKALHTTFEMSSGCQSWVWPAQVLCNDKERVGYIRKQAFQEEEMWGTTFRCEEKAPNHDLLVCVHVLSDWGLSWFTKASVLNVFLAGGSDDAWADAEDISEEDSALRFVCITGMRKRESGHKLTGSATHFCSFLVWVLGIGLRPITRLRVLLSLLLEKSLEY